MQQFKDEGYTEGLCDVIFPVAHLRRKKGFLESISDVLLAFKTVEDNCGSIAEVENS